VQIHTVMLIDDEPDIRRIAGLCLTRVGKWRVLLAASGEEALELLSREKPDVILLDIMMPLMDGVATLARLRDRGLLAGTPVIFMTAKGQKQEVERYRSLGVAGVIVKPFDPLTLPQRIRTIIASQDSP